MLPLSDLVSSRSGTKCKVWTFAWLIAAAMAANFAAPAAAHAAVSVDLSSTLTYRVSDSYDNSIDAFQGQSSFPISLTLTTDKILGSSSGSLSGSINTSTPVTQNPDYFASLSQSNSLNLSLNGQSISYDCAFPFNGSGSFFSFGCVGSSVFASNGDYIQCAFAGKLIGSGNSGNIATTEDNSLRAYAWDVHNNRYIQLEFDGYGFFVPTRINSIILVFHLNSTLRSDQYVYLLRPSVTLITTTRADNKLQESIDKGNAQMEDMHNDLMNTDGSSDIGSGALSGAQSALDEHMSFMEQVDALAGHFTSISSESDSSVTFPGIEFGQVKIPPAKVDIWEHMGALENPCKTICTGVFIFAWFNGMRALYGRIFHDDMDVILD